MEVIKYKPYRIKHNVHHRTKRERGDREEKEREGGERERSKVSICVVMFMHKIVYNAFHNQNQTTSRSDNY